MSRLPWHLLPSVELVRFKRIDFFPPRPEHLDRERSICISTKTRTIGDALALSTLPEKLKARYPGLKVYCYPRAFNPVVFYANPFVDGVRYLPERVFGDDSSWGEGHLITLKERFFDLPLSEPPRPKIYLTRTEVAWARRRLKAPGDSRPLCVIHPWGHTWKNVAGPEVWASAVERWRPKIRFLQVGIEGHPEVPGCEERFLVPRGFRHARKLFALMSQAGLFVGVNSGPMHVARAFGVPSLILIEEGESAAIFARRRSAPYYLHRNFAQAFLYEENEHLDLPRLGPAGAARGIDRALERFVGQTA